MKLRNIFIAGLSALAITACSDYLDVDAPSKNTYADVFADKVEMNRALNGVYTGLLSGNTFGDMIFTSFQLNSDVDFASNGSESNGSGNFRRFDCDSDGGNLKKAWDAIYEGIELANLFIEGVEASPIYNAEDPDPEVAQMLGEAKVIRAILYHELIWMFGDVPFSFNSSRTTTTKIYPITDRWVILDKLIADIESIADKMQSSADVTVERPNKEMAYGMIARLALTAGGYTLKPDGDTYGKMVRPDNYLEYYTKARNAAYEVIFGKFMGSHRLTKDFYKVFYDECNFQVAVGDDPMFEIPFGKNSTGNIGYIQGVRIKNYESSTIHNYGEAKSGATLNAFYRFMFDPEDLRRDYVNQLFYYDATATAAEAKCEGGYTVHNGKWSKLWVNGGLGSISTGNTGINYPYMRYTDVLLMFAEADNEINNGPTAEARAALAQVRERAFRGTTNFGEKVDGYVAALSGHDDFLKAVLDERKFEFAGENMRWRDLVRNNQYNVATYYNFWRYYAVAEAQEGTGAYCPAVSEYDFGPGNDSKWDYLPEKLFNLPNVDNIDPDGNPLYAFNAFPNSDVKVVRILNPYSYMTDPEAQAIASGLTQTFLFADWSSDNTIKNEVRYSLMGYIYSDALTENIYVIRNGLPERVAAPEIGSHQTAQSLPVLRYILPIPTGVIRRSAGQYVNQYRYSN